MDMQNVSNLEIPEGEVRTIHDKDSRLLWGRVNYDTKYKGDTFQQTYSGKNLIDLGTATYTDNGFKWTRANNTITGTGTWGVSRQYGALLSGSTTQLSNPLPAGTYTLSCNPPEGHILELSLYNSNDTRIFNGHTTSSVHYITFTLSEAATGIRLFCQGMSQGTAYNLTYGNIQIESGNQATSYEPYVGGIVSPNPDFPQPINVVTGEQMLTIGDGTSSQSYTVNLTSKNLFNKTATPYSFASSTVSQITNGIRVASTRNGTGLSLYVLYLLDNTKEYIGKTLTLSANMQASASNIPRILLGLCDSSGGNASGKASLYNNGSVSYQVENDPTRQYLFLAIYSTSGSTVQVGDYVDYTNIQLEVGSATPYTSYFTPIELCKIGDRQDYIYKSGDDWYVHKTCGKVVLDGSNDEDWAINYTGTANYFYRYRYISDYDYATFRERDGWKNNMASGGDIGSQTTANGSMITNVGELRLRYGAEMTLTNWKDKLAATNMILCYALVTPTDTKITDATLVGQLNAVHEWLIRYGYNATVSGNLPIIIDRTNL